jgi:hypothetical protein
MQKHKLGDAMFDEFVISATYCNDHDWGDNSSFDLENLFKSHDDYATKSGFGRVSTLVNNDLTYLESVQSYEFFDKRGFGEVMTLVDVNPTILEDYKTFMHVDHEENISHDSYIVEFEYDPTCKYYERGKYGYRNLHVTKLPLFMWRLLVFLSSSMHMLEMSCLYNLFAYKLPMNRKSVRLKYIFHMFIMLSLCFNSCLLCEHH